MEAMTEMAARAAAEAAGMNPNNWPLFQKQAEAALTVAANMARLFPAKGKTIAECECAVQNLNDFAAAIDPRQRPAFSDVERFLQDDSKPPA
jgi:hypothetical protein